MPEESWRISIDAKSGEWAIPIALDVSRLPVSAAVLLYRNTLIALTEIISSLWKDIETFKIVDDMSKAQGHKDH